MRTCTVSLHKVKVTSLPLLHFLRPGGGWGTDGDDRRINDFLGFDSGIFWGGKENCKYFNLSHPKNTRRKKKFLLKKWRFLGVLKQVKIRGMTRGSASACVFRLSSFANEVQFVVLWLVQGVFGFFSEALEIFFVFDFYPHSIIPVTCMKSRVSQSSWVSPSQSTYAINK